MGFASENGILRGLDDLLFQSRSHVWQCEVAQAGTIFVDEHVLADGWTPGPTGSDDGGKHAGLLALQCLADGLCIITH